MRLGQVVSYGVILCLGAVVGSAWAQSDPPEPTGVFPPVILQVLPSFDPTGVVETYNLGAPTVTATNPFFESLGTNGRACATCHEPRSAWGVSTSSIQQRFEQSDGTDPIFRPIDGATCPSDDVGTLAANDPYGCTTLASSPPVVSVYRRPLPSANLEFLIKCASANPGCAPLSIMWDGREPSLQSQSIDATLGHAQALNPPTAAQIAQIVAFETGIFDAQELDFDAGSLHALGASGGPAALSQQEFFIGINDVLSPGFTPEIFTLYVPWQNLPRFGFFNEERAAVARGEILFDSKPI